MANKQEMRITEKEKELLKTTFGDNLPLLKLLRKIFLPEIMPDAPLGQNIDLWMTVPVDNMTPEQALINLKARNTVIGHIELQLQTLDALSHPDETPEERVARLAKNSNK